MVDFENKNLSLVGLTVLFVVITLGILFFNNLIKKEIDQTTTTPISYSPAVEPHKTGVSHSTPMQLPQGQSASNMSLPEESKPKDRQDKEIIYEPTVGNVILLQ